MKHAHYAYLLLLITFLISNPVQSMETESSRKPKQFEQPTYTLFEKLNDSGRILSSTTKQTTKNKSFLLAALTYCYNGGTLVSGSHDNGIIEFWNQQSNEIHAFKITPPENNGTTTIGIQDIAYDPESESIATALTNGHVRVWNYSQRTIKPFKRANYKHHFDSSINSIANFSHNEQYLIACGLNDHTITLFNPTRRSLRAILKEHKGWVSCVTDADNGTKLISGSSDKTIRFWDIGTEKRIQKYKKHTPWVNAVAYNKSNQLCASADNQKTHLWDLRMGEKILTLKGGSEMYGSIAFHPTALQLSNGLDNQQKIAVWDLKKPDKPCHIFKQPTITSFSYSPDGKHLAVGSHVVDKLIKIYDI